MESLCLCIWDDVLVAAAITGHLAAYLSRACALNQPNRGPRSPVRRYVYVISVPTMMAFARKECGKCAVYILQTENRKCATCAHMQHSMMFVYCGLSSDAMQIFRKYSACCCRMSVMVWRLRICVLVTMERTHLTAPAPHMESTRCAMMSAATPCRRC